METPTSPRTRYYNSLTLGERLKYLRQSRELTQNDLARLLCVDRSTYAYYETGKTEPRLASIMVLAKYYNITLDRMLSGLLEVEQ